MNAEDILKQSVQYVKGVGPVRVKVFNRLGINTVEDLLYYFPRRYEDRSIFLPIAQLQDGICAAVKGRIITVNARRSKRGMVILQAVVGDDSGTILAVWFNQPFLQRYFKAGQEIILYGKAERYHHLQMTSPDFEQVPADGKSLHIGRIVPVYPLTAGLNQKSFRRTVSQAIQSCFSFIPDIIPYALRQRLGLLPLTLAVRHIHFPPDNAARETAHRRLVFEEFFLLQVILALKKIHQHQGKTGIAHQREGRLIPAFREALPFKLTGGQEKAIKEIEEDMIASRPMNRLLQGDVGSGKTIVAAYAFVLAAQSGFQAVLMAPTEILAEQHYLTLSKLFLPLDINVGLLIGSMDKQGRQNTIQEAQSGALNVVVGTHALLEEKVEFAKLGLVVIDEQHKFGVLQRGVLQKKGLHPDYLIMTATPIPRTLAMTVYGDLDISVIKELPPGRQPVTTIQLKTEAVGDVYKFVRQEIKKGRQAYIIYPLVKESAFLQLSAATEMRERLQKEEFAGLEVAVLHGQMKGAEKEKVMRDFQEHKIDALVSTTVIEVGIDVPNASVMVVMHAERFGLSQLHQLRGRVGRGRYSSYCILVSDPVTEKGALRMEALLSTGDGFRLAEEDLDIRGPGKIFGPAQHGLPELKLGNIVRDMETMELARREAFALLQTDPYLKHPQHALLKKRLREKFCPEKLGLLSV